MKKQGKMEKVHNASLINQQITFFKLYINFYQSLLLIILQQWYSNELNQRYFGMFKTPNNKSNTIYHFLYNRKIHSLLQEVSQGQEFISDCYLRPV